MASMLNAALIHKLPTMLVGKRQPGHFTAVR
jgi:hypothetical protein